MQLTRNGKELANQLQLATAQPHDADVDQAQDEQDDAATHSTCRTMHSAGKSDRRNIAGEHPIRLRCHCAGPAANASVS